MRLLRDNTRKVMSITEAVVDGEKVTYNPIFKYVIRNGVGQHEKVGKISSNLAEKMELNEIPQELLQKFM